MSEVSGASSLSLYSYISSPSIELSKKEIDEKSAFVKGNKDLVEDLTALSQFEFETLVTDGDTDNITIKVDDVSEEIELEDGMIDKVKSAIKKINESVNLSIAEIEAVQTFIEKVKTKDSEGVAVFGVSDEEYNETRDSKHIKYEEGTAESGVEYAVMNGISTDLAERLRKDAKPGKLKKPQKKHFESKLKELENKTDKTPQEFEELIGYRYIVENWEQFTKSGGKKKLSKSNIKQLDKAAGKDGFITLDDIAVSETLKKNYHRKKVWGTVAAAVVGTAATILTAGALGPVAAGAIGAAAGSIASGTIEGKKFGEILKDAGLAAAMGAVGGAAASGAGALAGKATANMTSEAAKAAVKAATVGAARGATTATLNDLADDGKINSVGNIGKQAALGAVSGAAASGVSSSMGDFGDTVAGQSVERGLQQSIQRAGNDATDGDGEFDWAGLGAEFAGGAVAGAAEQGLTNLSEQYIENPNDRLWVDGVTSGTVGFVSGAAGELVEGAIEGDIDGLELVTTASANMQTNAVNYDDLARRHQEKQLMNSYFDDGSRTWLGQAVHNVGNGIKQGAEWLYDHTIRPIANAGVWLYENAITPVVNGFVSAGQWVGETATNFYQNNIRPIFSRNTNTTAPAINYDEMKAAIDAGMPEPTINPEFLRAELSEMPEVMTDLERAAAIDNYNKTKYDDMSFNDAFASAMQAYKSDGEAFLVNGVPSFQWNGKPYALAYAPPPPPPPVQQYDFSAGGNGEQYGIDNNNPAGYDFNAGGNGEQYGIAETTWSTIGNGTAALIDGTAWSMDGVSESRNARNWTKRAAKGFGAVSDVVNVYNGAVDISNGEYVKGGAELIKGGAGLAEKYVFKKLPGVSFVAGVADGTARFQDADYVGGGLSILSGTLSTAGGTAALTGIGAPVGAVLIGASYVVDGVQLIYDVGRWWFSE